MIMRPPIEYSRPLAGKNRIQNELDRFSALFPRRAIHARYIERYHDSVFAKWTLPMIDATFKMLFENTSVRERVL